jgi:hypothetical protein
MSGRSISWTPRVQDTKDPDAARIKEMDWSRDLEEGAEISTSTWAVVDPPDADLVLSNPTVIESGTVASVLVSGGTPGQVYTIRNRITTNETPPQIDDKSFQIVIAEQ